eukprot:96424_1
MRAIQAINTRAELDRCGIKPAGHQTLILAEITALIKGGQRQALGASGSAPMFPPLPGVPPPPMVGGTWGNDVNPKNTYYEGMDGEGGLVGR